MFGIGFDVLHVIAYFEQSLLAQVLLVVEDGGEIVVMSAMTAYAFHVAAHAGRPRLDLWSVMRLQFAFSSNGRRWRTDAAAYAKPASHQIRIAATELILACSPSPRRAAAASRPPRV